MKAPQRPILPFVHGKCFNYAKNIMKAIQTCLILGLCASTLGAAPAIEKVVKQDGKVQVVQDGKLAPIKEPVSFSNNIKVNTNGLFKVGNGGERKLEEGQVLTAEGMLYSP